MTHATIDDDTLQTYLDGELEAGESARVATAIANDPVLALRLETLRLLGTGVRASEAELGLHVTETTNSDALFAAIEQRLYGPSVTHAPAVPAERRPVLRSILGGRAARIGIGTTGILALAAAVTLMVRPPNISLPSVPPVHVGTQIQAMSPRGTQIIDVEFGKHTGTHFTLEGEAGEPIAVVWIQEESTEARQ